MVELGDIVVGKHTGRHSPDDITLFCTAGLSGTEVAVASEALRRAGHIEGLEAGSSTRLDHMAREGGNDASDDDPHR